MKGMCTDCNREIPRKKDKYKCAKCGYVFCGHHIYSYVDGNNIAITKNSKEYCSKCYDKVYG